MIKEQDFIKDYKQNSFLPSLNFEGDLMVSEDELCRILKMYAEDYALDTLKWYKRKCIMSNFDIIMTPEKAIEIYKKEINK